MLPSDYVSVTNKKKQTEVWSREKSTSGLKFKSKDKALIWKFVIFHKQSELWLPSFSLTWKYAMWDTFLPTFTMELAYCEKMCFLQCALWTSLGE